MAQRWHDHGDAGSIDHARPHGSSQEFYKGILDGSARGAFDGRILVRPSARKTDAHQTNRNLILSDTALVDSKPQLEIYNNDVKGTHGSTTGRLDENMVFYVRSRGLDESAARSLLTFAFGSEIVEKVAANDLYSLPRGVPPLLALPRGHRAGGSASVPFLTQKSGRWPGRAY